MNKRQNEIEMLRKDINNVNYRNNWRYGFLCITILLFFAIMFLTFDDIYNKIKDIPKEVCENEVTNELNCSITAHCSLGKCEWDDWKCENITKCVKSGDYFVCPSYVIARMLCPNGIKKLHETDNSSFKLVECKIE